MLLALLQFSKPYKIKCVCVSYSFIVKMAAIELDKVFHSNKIITHLLLSHCVFELQSFSKIVPLLKLFGCLSYLDLSSTANSQYSADDISDVIESSIMLQHLNLSNCKLSGLRLMKITSSVTKLSMLKICFSTIVIYKKRIRKQENSQCIEMYIIFAVA